MKTILALMLGLSLAAAATAADSPPAGPSPKAPTPVIEKPAPAVPAPPTGAGSKVYILPIQEDIMPPLVYLVRRGVKEAMEAKADLLVLDMKTDGGRVDVTEEIIEIISKFKGRTATYVNNRAFSAGAFISAATQEIYMAPQSVIGAAAPILMSPTGGEPSDMPGTMEAKMTSAIRALVRAQAEKNGHNVEVIEAMIDKTKELKIGDEVLNKEGNILTLTDVQASKKYGTPPKPLFSLGTVETLDQLVQKLGFAEAKRVEIQPTGAEKLGLWINALGPILMIIGIIGLYIEFKTPGFGLPGIAGIVAFALYFLGGYVAGLSGASWMLVFLLGLALVAVELFIVPGTFVSGIAGAGLMLLATVMGMVDVYPDGPAVPTMPQLRLPLRDLSVAVIGSFVIALVLARFLPKTTLFQNLVSESASGVGAVEAMESVQAARMGQVGIAASPLYLGGKARFGSEMLDVISQAGPVEKGQPIRVIGHSGSTLLVEPVES